MRFAQPGGQREVAEHANRPGGQLVPERARGHAATHGRRQYRLGDHGDGLLGESVEAPHRLDLITEKFNAQRVVADPRKDIEDPPAHRDLATPLNRRHHAVAAVDQTFGQSVQVVFLPRLDHDASFGDGGEIRNGLFCRSRGADQ